MSQYATLLRYIWSRYVRYICLYCTYCIALHCQKILKFNLWYQYLPTFALKQTCVLRTIAGQLIYKLSLNLITHKNISTQRFLFTLHLSFDLSIIWYPPLSVSGHLGVIISHSLLVLMTPKLNSPNGTGPRQISSNGLKWAGWSKLKQGERWGALSVRIYTLRIIHIYTQRR